MMKLHQMVLTFILSTLLLCSHVIGAFALINDDVNWSIDAWEIAEYRFSDPYSQYIDYGQYPDESIELIKNNTEYYRNIWLCGTLVFPTTILQKIDTFKLSIEENLPNGIIVSNSPYYNMDGNVIDGEICRWRINMNLFIDVRHVAINDIIDTLKNGQFLSLNIVFKKSESTTPIRVNPIYDNACKRSVDCENLFTAEITSIEQVPRDSSTPESREWLEFANPNADTSWWIVHFRINLPSELKQSTRSVHMHSESLDIYDTNRKFLRLYGDVEYTNDVVDGEFESRLLCFSANASCVDIYRQLVDDHIQVWFSFEPLQFYNPWHACFGYIQ